MPIEDDITIRTILTAAKTIAVVGASNKPYRDSNRIAAYLKRKGYRVFLVNPTYSEIDGEPCFPGLASIGAMIDIVDVFRNSDAVPEIVDEAIAVHAKTMWLQLGVIHVQAAQRAEAAGVRVVMDHCIAVDHSRLVK
jgi:predicted CoA-binding protein